MGSWGYLQEKKVDILTCPLTWIDIFSTITQSNPSPAAGPGPGTSILILLFKFYFFKMA
jgi:hypothetical protein